MEGHSGHSDSVTVVCCSQSNKYIISGSKDDSIKIWKFSDGSLLNIIDVSHHVKSLCISADDDKIVSIF